LGIGLVLALSQPALSAVEGPGRTQLLQAGRAAGRITLDGKLDESSWARVPPFAAFVQSFPEEGARPSERTQVRVLYDDDNLYVGVLCFDSQPEHLVRQLSRRDRMPPSDIVTLIIDSSHDHRGGFLFSVNAGGVLRDGLFYQDTQSSDDWDAIWDAAVAPRADGWSAEFRIPLNLLLHFNNEPEQTWGFFVRRELARTHEVIDSVLIPRNANGLVSRFGHLTGLVNLASKRDFELTPYLASRLSLRPQFSEGSTPQLRLLDPSADAGLDLKVALNRGLTLNATLNPDFGQVEADQMILNLSNFEQFYPEKRPFFTQGMDAFQPVGGEVGQTPHTLFYSRRIGLTTPILGALKITGKANQGLDVGVLNALVAGNSAVGSTEVNPDRRLQYSWVRPFHLSPKDSLPSLNPVTENYFVAVAEKSVGRNSMVGGAFSAATPFGPRCSEEQTALSDAERPPACDARGGNAAALNWNLRAGNSEWVMLGQASASQSVAGSPSRTLKDGTVLKPGDLGYGAYFTAGRIGGEPLRYLARYEFASAKLDLNATGFQPNQNLHSARSSLAYVRPTGFGSLHFFQSTLSASKSWSSDRRLVDRGLNFSLDTNAVLSGFHTVGCGLSYDDPQFDIREISTTGIPFERQPSGVFSVYGQSDSNRLLSFGGGAGFGWRPRPKLGSARVGYGGNAHLVLRPQPRLETQLETTLDYTPHGPRYVDGLGGDQFLFGRLDSGYLSFTLRQQLVLSPKLTLQAYAQLFTAYGQYGPFFVARSEGRPIRLADLTLTEYGSDPSFHKSNLNLNLVLRWEYRLGSTLFLVYTRSQSELPVPSGAPTAATLWPRSLGAGLTSEVFLIKWSYWWSA
jgi:hypothetical protein